MKTEIIYICPHCRRAHHLPSCLCSCGCCREIATGQPHKEIPFKQWKAEEAERRGTTLHALEMLLTRGQVARPPMRVVNQRVKFVATCPTCGKSNCPGAQRSDDCPTWESRTHGETEYVARKEDVQNV